MALDETHDPARVSFVETAQQPGCDFPIQNLPFGVICPGGGRARVAVAIGDHALCVAGAADALGFSGDARRAADASRGGTLNALAELGRGPLRALRLELSRALAHGPDAAARA